MPAKVCNLQHMIFAPKYRRHLLQSEQVSTTAAELIRHICQLKGIEIKALAIMPDHVHLFVILPATMSVSDAAYIVKWFSSIHLRRIYPEIKRRSPKALWATRYFSRSVGGDAATVQAYVDNQIIRIHAPDYTPEI